MGTCQARGQGDGLLETEKTTIHTKAVSRKKFFFTIYRIKKDTTTYIYHNAPRLQIQRTYG